MPGTQAEEGSSVLEAGDTTRFTELIEASDGLSFVLDAQGVVRWVSRKLCELLGLSMEGFVGRVLVELLHPDDRARTSREAERIRTNGAAIRFQNRFRCSDGTYRWLSWSALVDETKGLAYALAFDITDAKRAERVTAEAKLAARLGGWEWNFETQALYLTEGSYRLLELSVGEELSATSLGMLEPADQARLLDLDEKARVDGSPFSLEFEVHLPSGRKFWALLMGKPELEAGRVAKVRGTIQDVTEQRLDRIRAVDARAATERLLANVPGGFAFRCRLDEALTMEWMSEGVLHVTGYPVSAFVDGLVEYRALLTPGEEMLIRSTVVEAEVSGGEFENEHLIRARDGAFRWVLCRGRLLLGPDGSANGLEGFMLDITERRAVEDSLRAREAELFAASQRLSLLIENVGAAVVEFDAEGRIHYANGIAGRLIGIDPSALVGRELSELPDANLVEAQSAKIRLAIDTGTASYEELPAEVGGTRRIFQTRLYPQIDPTGELATAVLIAHDVTEQRSAEAQLLLADRMVSMGTMAAGVAHEINNPLTYILGNISYSLQQLDELRQTLSNEHQPFFDDIDVALRDAANGAERVASIVRDLRLFSRLEDDPPRSVNLGPVLESVVRMMKHEIEHRAVLELDIEEAPPVVGTDARLGQVFTNLIVNAMQALPDRPPHDNLVRLRLWREGDDAAVVEVADNGPGIPAEARKRIFDPFFTTKPAGQGTGLGLSICHGIVSALGGTIEVDDTFGAARGRPAFGATFRVKLPCTRIPIASPAFEPDVTRRSAPPERPRVFLVEDDPSVARSLKRILGRSYDVVVEHDAPSLLARVVRGETASAIVCDLMMPGMDGPELYAEIQKHSPELAAHCGFISGGAFTERTVEFVRDLPEERLLAKPFSSASLRAFLARLLR